MLNYELFKKEMVAKFVSYLPDDLKNAELEIITAEKINQQLDTMIVKQPDCNISPNIYLNQFYEEYLATGDLEDVIEEAANLYEMAFRKKDSIDMNRLKDINFAKDKIVFQLINTVQNRDMLKRMPHREFHDLSIVYRLVVEMNENGFSSFLITDDYAGNSGMSEEELFALAKDNTWNLLPPKIANMRDIMKNILALDDMDSLLDDTLDKNLYVISNDRGINGAATMLYENVFYELATELDSDLYILPSSVHEVIALAADGITPEELADMVSEVNMSKVDLSERLSNQVYLYDKDLRKLSLATDTPNKRLDGVIE